MRNRIQYIVLIATLLSVALFHIPSHAQKRGFDDDLVAGLVSSYYAVRGVSIPCVKSAIQGSRFAKGKKTFVVRVIVLRDGRVLLTRNGHAWSEARVTQGVVELTHVENPNGIVAFDATTANRTLRHGVFNFHPTHIIPVIPPTIVTPERFLNHLITWLRARGIFDLANLKGKLALYDLIARNPYVRVAGVEDIELVLIGLRELGLDLDHFDEFGDTMLFAAIREDDVDFVRALVNVGIDLNLVNNDAQMPDEFALEFGNEEIMDLLDAAVSDDVEEEEQEEKEEKSDSDLDLERMDVAPRVDFEVAPILSELSFGSC